MKSPSRVKIFKTRAPNTPLPPTPVITRWGTWVDAVKYYATNFELVYSVVNELDREDASSIAILQDVFQTPSELTALKTDLVFISANFCFLSDIITKLEKSKLLLTESLKEIDNIENKLNEICGSKANIIKQKFLLCLNKNKGLQVIRKIYDILMGNNVEHFEQMEHLSVSDIVCYKYVRLTSCDKKCINKEERVRHLPGYCP